MHNDDLDLNLDVCGACGVIFQEGSQIFYDVQGRQYCRCCYEFLNSFSELFDKKLFY